MAPALTANIKGDATGKVTVLEVTNWKNDHTNLATWTVAVLYGTSPSSFCFKRNAPEKDKTDPSTEGHSTHGEIPE